MADITEDINFDDLCSTCEQMELDVSEVEISYQWKYFLSYFSSRIPFSKIMIHWLILALVSLWQYIAIYCNIIQA